MRIQPPRLLFITQLGRLGLFLLLLNNNLELLLDMLHLHSPQLPLLRLRKRDRAASPPSPARPRLLQRRIVVLPSLVDKLIRPVLRIRPTRPWCPSALALLHSPFRLIKIIVPHWERTLTHTRIHPIPILGKEMDEPAMTDNHDMLILPFSSVFRG